MFYTIYQITCTVNRKIYIGKHQTTDLNDGYMGSGKILKRAIDLYGIENFQKEILHVFDNEEEMNRMEAEIVNEQFLCRDDVYNICLGGQGGFSYINSRGLNNSNLQREKSRDLILEINKNLKKSENWKQKVSKTLKGRKQCGGTKGITFSTQTKSKMSEAHSGKQNSQFGTCWITNGTENKKIKSIDIIPEGWYKGRK